MPHVSPSVGVFFFILGSLLSQSSYAQTAEAAYEKGKAATTAKNNAEATAAYEEGILLVRKESPGALLHFKIANNLGLCYSQAGELEKAISSLEEAHAIGFKLLGNNDIKFAETSANLGQVWGMNNSPAKLVYYFKMALPAYTLKYGKNSKEILPLQYNIATKSQAIGDLATTNQYLKIITANTTVQGTDKAMLVGALAMNYYQAQEYDSAEIYFKQRIEIEEALYGRKNKEFLQTLNELGGNYFDAGYYGKAEACFLEVYNTEKELPEEDHQLMARVLNNLGNCQSQLGKYQSALNYYNEALRIKELLYKKDDHNYLVTLTNIAAIHQLTGKYDEALAIQQSIYDIEKQSRKPDDRDLILAHLTIGQTLEMLGRLDESAVIIQDVLKYLPNSYEALSSLGTIYSKQRKSKDEENIRLRMLEGTRTVNSRKNYSAALMSLAKFYWRQNDMPNSKKYYLEAMDQSLLDLRNNFAYQTEQGKLQYLKNMLSDEETFVALAVNEYQAGRPDLISKAYEYSATIKGIVLNSTTATRKWIFTNGTKEQKVYYNRWRTINGDLAAMALNIVYETPTSIVGSNQIQRLANRMEKNIIAGVGEGAVKLATGTWKDISNALAQNEGVVELFRTDADSLGTVRYVAIVVGKNTNNNPDAIVFNDGNTLETKYVRYYQNSINAKTEDLVSYEKFWAPIQKKLTDLGITKVYFAPAGVYNQINLNTLLNPVTHAYLINELDIAYVTSGFDVIDPATPVSKNKSAVLVGSPIFATQPHSDPATRNYFVAIPGTQTEVDAIATLMKVNRWKVNKYTGKDATETTVKEARQPSILHIATHGYFIGEGFSEKIDKITQKNGGSDYLLGSDKLILQNDRMMRSGLVLTGATDFLNGTRNTMSLTEEDGLLTAFEVSGLSLENTDLVVLSACETGLGDVDASEGVFGLQRAFRAAGANHLIMSLWSVSDQATTELMTTFYSEFLKSSQLDPSFRKAQIATMKKYPHPYFWGAFVLLGK